LRTNGNVFLITYFPEEEKKNGNLKNVSDCAQICQLKSAIKILNMNSHQCPPGPNYACHKVHDFTVCQHFSQLGRL